VGDALSTLKRTHFVIPHHHPLQTPVRPRYSTALLTCLTETYSFSSETTLIATTKIALCSISSCIAWMETNPEQWKLFFFCWRPEWFLQLEPESTRKKSWIGKGRRLEQGDQERKTGILGKPGS